MPPKKGKKGKETVDRPKSGKKDKKSKGKGKGTAKKGKGKSKGAAADSELDSEPAPESESAGGMGAMEQLRGAAADAAQKQVLQKQVRAHRVAALRAARAARRQHAIDVAARAAARDPQLELQAEQLADGTVPERTRYRRLLRFLSAAPNVDMAPLPKRVVDALVDARDEGDGDGASRPGLVDRLRHRFEELDPQHGGVVDTAQMLAVLEAEGVIGEDCALGDGDAEDVQALLRRFQLYKEPSSEHGGDGPATDPPALLNTPSSDSDSDLEDAEADGDDAGGKMKGVAEKRQVYWIEAILGGFGKSLEQTTLDGNGGSDAGDNDVPEGSKTTGGGVELTILAQSAVPVTGQDESTIGSIPAPFGPPLCVRETARLGDKAGGSGEGSDSTAGADAWSDINNGSSVSGDNECVVRRHVGDGAINGPCSFGSVLCDRQHSFLARAYGSAAKVMGVDLGGDQRMLEVRFDLVELSSGPNSANDEYQDADNPDASGDASNEGSAADTSAGAIFGLCGELLRCGEHDVTIRLERQPPLGAHAPHQPVAGPSGDAEDSPPEEGNALIHELTLRGSGTPFAFPPDMAILPGDNYRIVAAIVADAHEQTLEGAAGSLPRIEVRQRCEWVKVPSPVVAQRLMVVGSVQGLEVTDEENIVDENRKAQNPQESVQLLLRSSLDPSAGDAGDAALHWPATAQAAAAAVTAALAAESAASHAATIAVSDDSEDAPAAGAQNADADKPAASASDVGKDLRADAKAAAAAASSAAALAADDGVYTYVQMRNGPFELDSRAVRLPAPQDSAAAMAAASVAAAGGPVMAVLAPPAPANSPAFLDLWAPEMAMQVTVPVLGLVLALELRKAAGWIDDAEIAESSGDMPSESKDIAPAASAVQSGEAKDGAKDLPPEGANDDDMTASADVESKRSATRGAFRLFGTCVSCSDSRLVTLELLGAEHQVSIGEGENFGFPEAHIALPELELDADEGGAESSNKDLPAGKDDESSSGDPAAAKDTGDNTAVQNPSQASPFQLLIKCGHVTVTLSLEEVWAEEYSEDVSAAARTVTKHIFKGMAKGMEHEEMAMALINPTSADLLFADAVAAGVRDPPTDPDQRGAPIMIIGDTSSEATATIKFEAPIEDQFAHRLVWRSPQSRWRSGGAAAVALPKTNEPPLMLEVQIDVAPAGVASNAAERKSNVAKDDVGAKHDEGDENDVKDGQGVDKAEAKPEDSQGGSNATKQDEKEDENVKSAAKDQEDEDAAKTGSQDTPPPPGAAGTGPEQHTISGVVRGLPPGAEVTVDLRDGTTVECDGIDVILFKGREEHRVQQDGTFEFVATIDEDMHYRLDINVDGAPEPNPDDADAKPHHVQTSFTHEKKVVEIAALGHVDGEEAVEDYSLCAQVHLLKKDKAHLKKKKKKKKKKLPYGMLLADDTRENMPWGAEEIEVEGRELNTWHNKQRVVDSKWIHRQIITGKEHTYVFSYPPIELRAEVRRESREEVIRDPDTGARQRIVHKEWHIRGNLKGLEASKDFRYFEITLNGHHAVKLTRDGMFKFTDWYYTPPGVLLSTDSRPDEIYRLEVNTQRLWILMIMKAVRPDPPELTWVRKQHVVTGTLYGLAELNEHWGLKHIDWSIDDEGKKVRSEAMRGCDVLLLANKVGQPMDDLEEAKAILAKAEEVDNSEENETAGDLDTGIDDTNDDVKAESKGGDSDSIDVKDELDNDDNKAEGKDTGNDSDAVVDDDDKAADSDGADDKMSGSDGGEKQAAGENGAASDGTVKEAKAVEPQLEARALRKSAETQAPRKRLTPAEEAAAAAEAEAAYEESLWYKPNGPTNPRDAERMSRAPKQPDLGLEGWCIPRGRRWVEHRAMRLVNDFGIMQEAGGSFMSKPTHNRSKWINAITPIIGVQLQGKQETQHLLRGRVAGLTGATKDMVITQTDASPFITHKVSSDGDWSAPPTAARCKQYSISCLSFDVEFSVDSTFDEEEEEEVWVVSGALNSHTETVIVSFRGEDITLENDDQTFTFEDTMDSDKDYHLNIKTYSGIDVLLENSKVTPYMIGGVVTWPTHEMYEVFGELKRVDNSNDNDVKIQLQTTSTRRSVEMARDAAIGRQAGSPESGVRDKCSGVLSLKVPTKFHFEEMLEVRTHTLTVKHDPYEIIVEFVPEGEMSVRELVDAPVAVSAQAPNSASDDEGEAEATEDGKDGEAETKSSDATEASTPTNDEVSLHHASRGHIRTLFDHHELVGNIKGLLVRGRVKGGLVGESLHAMLHTAEEDAMPLLFEAFATPTRLPKGSEVMVVVTPTVNGSPVAPLKSNPVLDLQVMPNGEEYVFVDPVVEPLHTVVMQFGHGDDAVRLELRIERFDSNDNVHDGSGKMADRGQKALGADGVKDNDAEVANDAAEGQNGDSNDALDAGEGQDSDGKEQKSGSASAVSPNITAAATDRRIRVCGSCSGLQGKQQLVMQLSHESAVAGQPNKTAKKKKKKGKDSDSADSASHTVTLSAPGGGDFAFAEELPPFTESTSISVLLTFKEMHELLVAGVGGNEDGADDDKSKDSKKKKKKKAVKPPKKGAKPPTLLWGVRPRLAGQAVEVDAENNPFAFERLIPPRIDSTLSLTLGDIEMDLALRKVCKKRGTGCASLVLDGDEDNAVLIDGDREPNALERGFTFPTFVEEGAPWKVQVSTEIPCDVQGRVHKKAGKPVPLDLTLQTKEQRLLKIKGELDGLGFERLLILRLELEWHGEMIEITALEHTHYKVFVEAHPHAQTCTLTSFAGVLHGVKDVDNVRATCTDNPWEVGGILTGIKPGLSAVLLLKLTSGIYSLAIDAIGSFTFAIPVCEGSRYKVEFKDPMKQMAFLRKHGIKLWVQNADGIVQQPEKDKKAEAKWKEENPAQDPTYRKGRFTGVGNVRVLPTIRDPSISEAAALGDADEVVRLLGMGHDIEYRDSDKRTALFGAAQFGQVEAMSVLLSRIYEEDLPLLDGADATDSFGVTPFIQAAQGGYVESVKQLEDMEVEVHNEDETDRGALFHAAYNDHAAVVRHLVLETKLAADCRDLAGLTPLVVAAQCNNIATLKVLLEEAVPPADIHAAHHVDGTALIHAAAKGHLEAVQYLLDMGAGEQRLAIADGDAGASDEAASQPRRLPHKHKKHKKRKKHKKKQRGGAGGDADVDEGPLPTSGIDTRDLAKCTALTRAALGGHVEVVKLLAEYGAALDPRGRASETPLLMVARLGHFEVVRELLDAGADATALNHWGESALDIAKEEEQEEVLELLLEHMGMGSDDDL